MIYIDTSVALLHLATLEHVRSREPSVRLATYDERLGSCARKMRVELYELRA